MVDDSVISEVGDAILHGSSLRCGGLTAVLVGGQRSTHHAGGPHLVFLKTKNILDFFEDLVLPRESVVRKYSIQRICNY